MNYNFVPYTVQNYLLNIDFLEVIKTKLKNIYVLNKHENIRIRRFVFRKQIKNMLYAMLISHYLFSHRYLQ